MTARKELQGREIILFEGPHDKVVLPLSASKHKTITMADGEQYFRMDGTYRPATEPGQRDAQGYLWSKWWDEKVKRMGKQERLEFPA